MAESAAALSRWFIRQQRARRRYVSLHSLVFGTDMLRYLLYRTRYMLAVSFLRITLHIAEFSLIIYALPTVVYHAMIYRLMSLAIESAWWGTTDTMRHRIRLLRKQRDINGIQREMTGWLTLALILAAVVGIAYLGAAWFGGEGYLPFSVLIAAMGFQTALRIITRTFYSGAYAMRRVFMPIELVLGPEIIIFLLGLLLRNWLSDWSVAICIVMSTLITSAVSYRYVRHVTDFLRITPRNFFSRRMWAHVITRHPLTTLLIPALAAIGMRLHDVLLIIALQYVSVNKPDAQPLLFSLYLIMPLLRSCMNWSQLMYFDLSKYSLDFFAGFRLTLERMGLVYSLFLAVLFGLMSLAVLWMFAATPFASAVRIILPYMLGSATLGFILISLFARKRYGAVIALTGLQYTLLWELLVIHAEFPMGEAMLLSLVLPLLLGYWQLQLRWNPPPEPIEPILRWISLLRARSSATRIFKLSFHPAATRNQLLRAAREIAFERELGTVCVQRQHVLVMMPASSGGEDTLRMQLLEACGGYVTSIEVVHGASGKEACAQAMATGLMSQLSLAGNESFDALKAEFFRRFPGGMLQIPMRKNSEVLARIESHERRHLLHEARLGAALSRKHYLPHWFVTSAYRKPYLAAIFIVPKTGTTDEERTQWREWLERHNLSALQAEK